MRPAVDTRSEPVQPTSCYEVRRDSRGQRGPKPPDFRSYDERQLASAFDDVKADVSGHPLAE